VRTRHLAAAGIFIALVFVITRYTVMPIPATKGYFNLGEVAIYIAAIAFGPLVGMLAGGLGSALADLHAGYQHYALFTLIIKGVEGYLVGQLAGATPGSRLRGLVVGGAWMVLGYFLAQTLFFRFLGFADTRSAALAAALTELPFNVVQAGVGIVVALPVTLRLRALAGQAS
jgi:uncharacterized membrane protein